MKNTNIVIAILLSAILFACNNTATEKIGNPISDIKLESEIMTPEVLWKFGRIGSVDISPDSKSIVFGTSFYSVKENSGNSEIFILPIEGGEAINITNTKSGEYSALWRPDGEKIGYLSAQSGSMQLWEMNADGSNKVQISNIDGGINGFKYSSDQTKILYTKDVKLDESVNDLHPDLPKANARIETDLMYRHWDRWHDYTYSHVFVADYKDGKISNSIDIMKDEKNNCPLEPFAGMEQVNWSPDCKNITYTSKKLVGKEYTLSTNSEVYIYNLASKETSNISKGMMGYDVAAVYSPNGKMIAWESMKHNGYEADRNRMFIYNFDTKTKKEYTINFDQNVHGLTWTADSKEIYFTSDYHARYQIYKLDVETEKISQITKGIHNYYSAIPLKDKVIGTKQSMSSPTEIFSINIKDKTETQLSFINKNILDQLNFGEVKKRWITTTDNKKMLTWVIYPPNFDAKKKYPTLLYCQGGPQSSVSQFFSYRWNFQMMAANGYIIVAPNRRGLPSFGQEWNAQISKDYGGQNMKDYLSAIDELAKEPYVDNDNLGAIGASYGGFSVFWLAGHHE
ncbi:MAG: prolyl oligopeptidase family serine peptidase, partial [Bacteroidota bacterium]|nr:prolyl oligopeptidase family serine peptidase [Bacteroidota bacterium]